MAQAGGFDLPSGSGYGNGTAGSGGVRGVVASAGFGSGMATGDGSGRANSSRGNGVVRPSGFGDAESAAPARAKAAQAPTPRLVPPIIVSKPTPLYTEEARKMHIEGEVVLQVVFEASGKLRVSRIIHGLGHGLDESAVEAAQQIRFKPAMRNGLPSDSTAVLHILFQLT
jgi:TonB family protein